MAGAFLLCLASLGCAVAGGARGVSSAELEQQRLTCRAAAALERLRVSYEGPAQVTVVDSQDIAAWSWADGSICLTSALVRLLDDNEIAGVIAHELGHLTHAEGGCQGFALGGPRTADEQHADAVAIILLRTGGVPAKSLAHALAKVRDALPPGDRVRDAMTARIAILPQ